MRTSTQGIFYSLLVTLLAFAPLIHGGHDLWPALLLSLGIAFLATLLLLNSVSDFSFLLAWCWEDFFLLLAAAWLFLNLKRPSMVSDAKDHFTIISACVLFFLVSRALSANFASLLFPSALLAAGGFLVVIGLFQMADIFPHGWWRPSHFLASTFINHNHFAAYLEMLLPVNVMIFFTKPLNKAQKFFAVVALALMTLGVLASNSRGAWLSLAVAAMSGFALFWASGHRFQLGFKQKLFGSLILLALIFLMVESFIFTRMRTLPNMSADPSFYTRLAMWKSTWSMISQQPFWGHGLGSFVYMFPLVRPAGLYRLVNYAHNEYLHTAAEIGVPGLVITLAVVFAVWGRIFRAALLSRNPWKKNLSLGGLVGLTSVLIHSFFDFPFHIPAVAFTFCSLAGFFAGITYQGDPHPMRLFQPGLLVKPARYFLSAGAFAVFTCVAVILTPMIHGDVLSYMAHFKRSQGRFEDAINLCQKAIQKIPYRPAYRRQLAESLLEAAEEKQGYEKRSFLKQAAKVYEEALVLLPQDSRNAHELGQILVSLGDLPQAEQWFLKALSLDQNNPVYWKDLGELSRIRGNAPQAAKAFQTAASLANPFDFLPSIYKSLNDPDYFNRQAYSDLVMKRQNLARTEFLIAKQLSPLNLDAQAGLAITALSEGDLEKAQTLALPLDAPEAKAKWQAALAQHYLAHNDNQKAQEALSESLKLDKSNMLARHIQLLLSKTDTALYAEAIKQLVSLNQPPVFLVPSSNLLQVVWQPEKGNYDTGNRTKDGWSLNSNGAIRQPIILPSGKVRFRVTVRGTQAKGLGPKMILSWNDRPLLTTEVKSEDWVDYTVEAEVQPGESQMSIEFINDLNDKISHRDRNLKLNKVVATWEGF